MPLGEHGSQPWTGKPEGQGEMKAEPVGEKKKGPRPEREREPQPQQRASPSREVLNQEGPGLRQPVFSL